MSPKVHVFGHNLCHINDNSTRFTNLTVYYSWTNDTKIDNVQATDDDSGSKISYFVGTPSNYIQLDHKTGNLSHTKNNGS